MKASTVLRSMAWLVLAGCAGSVAAKEPVPLKDFVRKPEFLTAKISPNGEYLAVTIPVDDQSILAVIDMKTRKVSSHLRWDWGGFVGDYVWVGPDRIVAEMAKSEGPLEQPRQTGELFGVNADGSNKRYLFGYRGGSATTFIAKESEASWAWAFVLDPMTRQAAEALIAVVPWHGDEFERPAIERIDVNYGTRNRVAFLPGSWPLDVAVDKSGALRFAFSTDEDNLQHLYVRAAVPGGWKEVARPNGTQNTSLHGVTPDGKTVLLTSSDLEGRACLLAYALEGGALTERACAERGTIGTPILSFDESELIGMIDEAGKPELRIVNDSHPDARLRQVLARTFRGQRVRVTSRTRDGRKIVVFVDSDRNPGDYYLVDRDTKKAEYLLSRRNWIDPAAMAPSLAVSYKTRDGATVHGYLTVQGGEAARKMPLVLMPHGGPHGVRDFWQWDPWAQALASRGYAVLQVNFRGSGGYGVLHERAGYRNWGTLMQNDLTDAVKWVVGQGIADGGRVCIMGASYGGYAALMSPLREPELYRCAIAFAGVYDIESLVSGTNMELSRYGRRDAAQIFGSGAEMEAQSPLTHVEKLKIPVLIAHGTEDKVVPFSQAKKLRKALNRHKKAYEWLEYEDEEHGFWVDANHEDFMSKALAFLDKHIGAGATPAAPAAGAQTQ